MDARVWCEIHGDHHYGKRANVHFTNKARAHICDDASGDDVNAAHGVE